MDGFRYIDFIVPGLVLMSVILNSYANTSDDIAIVLTFVLAPLTYLGGVFYSIQCLR